MQLPRSVCIIEVGPRDGLQAEPEFIPTNLKVEIIDSLSKTGLREIQATSFVHPRAIPQLADASEVMDGIDRRAGVLYQVLIPNLRGLQRAIAARANVVHLMLSASESHNRANANRSIEESLREFEQLVPAAVEAGIRVDGGIACAFGCPFEGEVPVENVERVVKRYLDAGITAIVLGDTIGVANPRQTYDVCARLLDTFEAVQWTLHLHNTRGMALANVLAAMQAGFTRFDGAIGGLGGCPYAPGATGNVATEDLVYMLEEMGIETGVEIDNLLATARMLQRIVHQRLESSLVRAGKRTELKVAPKEQKKIG